MTRKRLLMLSGITVIVGTAIVIAIMSTTASVSTPATEPIAVPPTQAEPAQPSPAPKPKIKTAEPAPKPAPTVKKATPAPKAPAKPKLSSSSISASEQEMIDLTNDYRSKHKLGRLAVNTLLMASAQTKADDMCKYNYWHHNDSQDRPFYHFIQLAGYNYYRAGENLAKGFYTQSSAFKSLLASPTHYANIIGDYREIGVGFNSCGGLNYTAIHYGSR